MGVLVDEEEESVIPAWVAAVEINNKEMLGGVGGNIINIKLFYVLV